MENCEAIVVMLCTYSSDPNRHIVARIVRICTEMSMGNNDTGISTSHHFKTQSTQQRAVKMV